MVPGILDIRAGIAVRRDNGLASLDATRVLELHGIKNDVRNRWVYLDSGYDQFCLTVFFKISHSKGVGNQNPVYSLNRFRIG